VLREYTDCRLPAFLGVSEGENGRVEGNERVERVGERIDE